MQSIDCMSRPHNGGMTVRAATPADAGPICDVCARAFREDYRGLLPEERIEQVIAEYYNESRVRGEIEAAPPEWLGYQVVEEDGRVLGAAGGGLTGPAAGELYLISLDPAQRNRGLGSALLARVTEQLVALGATEMWLSVAAGAAESPFFQARGFEKVELTPADVPTWRLRRRLAVS